MARIIGALAAVALVVEPLVADATFAGRNGKIAFSDGEPGRIFALDPDGGDRRRLTPARLHAFGPAYSPDGRRIAFTAIAHPVDAGDEHHIYVMNADGSRLHRLTDEDDVSHAVPVWSPDGRKIAFIRNAAAQPNLYLMNADGTKPRLLATEARSAAFSPDGRTIVFEGGYRRAPGLYAVRPDGSGERRLTTDTRRHASPDFSPDGRRIVFVRVTGQAGFSGSGSVNVIDADGGHRRRLTGRSLDRSPLFSPDGRKILFTRFVGGAPDADEMWVMNSDGTRRRLLADGRVRGYGPSWQPLPRK